MTASLRPRLPRVRHALVLPVVAALLAVAACGGDDNKGGNSDSANQTEGGGSVSAKKDEPPKPKFTLTPAVGATGVAPASTVTLKVDRGTLTTVGVKSGSGDVVEGTVGPGGKTWTSKGKLTFGATYAVTAATSEAATPASVGTFTTATPANSVRTSSSLGDGKSYGIGMPIILKLSSAVRGDAQRAAYEKMLTVRSTPATTGAWGWVNSRELHFRPKTFWAAGSKVHVTVDSAGRALGEGAWSRTDLTIDFTIGSAREMRVNSATKQMQVLEGGKTVRTIPVSLGKPKFPSSSGTMVVIDKRPEAMFDSSTYGLAVDAPDGYRTKVQYPIRLTWGGEFIHSAPWSVRDQGHRNVSHGCINVAPAHAKWLYDRVRTGDPVTVTNTEAKLKAGNGWTAWSVPYATWVSNSASGEVSTAAR